MRDSIVFYRSFYEAIKELPPNVQPKIYSAIFEYSLNFNDVLLDGLPKTIFSLIKPQLDANIRKFDNGKKGGRPKANDNLNETKTKPNNNLTVTKTEANANDNVNDNVNDECIAASNIFEIEKQKAFTNLFSRVSNWDSQTIKQEVAKFMNKYPFNEPNKSGGLINTWVANFKGNVVLMVETPEEMHIRKMKNAYS